MDWWLWVLITHPHKHTEHKWGEGGGKLKNVIKTCTQFYVVAVILFNDDERDEAKGEEEVDERTT